MPFSRFLLRLMVISLVLLPAVCSGQDQQPADIGSLRKQIRDLQEQVAELKAAISGTSSGNALPTSAGAPSQQNETKEQIADELNKKTKHQVGQAVGSYETYSQDPEAAARADNAPLDPRYPGYFRLPGTHTLLKIGGYFKSDFIRDIRPAGDTERFIPSSIPVPSSGGTTNSMVSVRPTRLNLDFLVPTEGVGAVRFYVEGDLFGTNATTPRMRHAYVQVRNFLIGQTFSNFQDPDAGPDQLDFQGPNSQVALRNPQFRYSVAFSKQTTLRFSLEKASSDVAFKTPEFSASPSNQAPDGVVTFRQEWDRGHVQISGMFRSVGAFLPNGVADSVFGWGIHGAGSLKTIDRDTLVYQVAYGHGIERYLNDTSGLGIDATVISAQRPELRALPVFATYGAYQHFWSKGLRSSVIYGFLNVENTGFQSSSAFHESQYTAANLIWNPFGALNVGAEFLYGWVDKKNSATGNAPRLMLSAKYSFVKSQSSK